MVEFVWREQSDKSAVLNFWVHIAMTVVNVNKFRTKAQEDQKHAYSKNRRQRLEGL